MNRSVSAGRALRVTHVSSAHRSSDGRIHLREAASLAAAGYDVTVVAVGHDLELPITGVKVVSLKVRTRMSRVTIGTIAAISAALRTRPDIVHLHDPELVWAIVPLRLIGKSVIYDAHEDLPMQMLGKAYLPNRTRLVGQRVARAAIRLASKSDYVVAATTTIADAFPTTNVAVVHNYPKLRTGDSVTSELANRPPRVGYLGVMSCQRGAIEMIDSFASKNFPDEWRATLAGPASPETLLVRLQDRDGWARVDYKGILSNDGARDLLSGCRVGVVVLQRSPTYLDSLPTKMFEYFAAGIPVVASDFPLWRSIVEKYDCGLLVDETSPEAIASAIGRYAAAPELLAQHGRNAFAAAQGDLNWRHEETTLLGVYDELSIATRRSRVRQ